MPPHTPPRPHASRRQAGKGEVSLQQIAAAKAQNALTMPDRIFEALLEMAGTSVDEIQKITKFEPLIAKG